MTAPNDLDRQLDAFLRDGPAELPDPSFDAVRDRMETTRQRVVIGPWRMPDMNKLVPIGLGAAVVAGVLLVGSQLLGSPTSNVAAPAVVPTPAPTPKPTPQLSPSASGLPEGPVLILTGEGDSPETSHPPLTVTIPGPGWEGDVGGGVLTKNNARPPDGAGMIIFAQQEYYVYGDPCDWESTVPDAPVTTVDEFVAALSSQASRNASEPVDITVGGYSGKSITLHIPDDADLSQCDQGTFGSWRCGTAADPPCGFHGGPGETDIEYILDVDGVLMAWHTGYEDGTPADVVAELEAIVQSATFGE
jgi:hypothetical protein